MTRRRPDLSRRDLILGAAAASAGTLLGASLLAGGTVLAAAPPTAAPRAASGRRSTDPRLVLVLLRGGMDGLSTLVPHGDPHYASVRGALALDEGCIPLDATFSLAPALASLAPLWEAGELLPVHATCTPYRQRSHFDAQDVLETGGEGPVEPQDGWLYRALQAEGRLPQAIGLARSLPLVLRGEEAVASVDPLGELLDESGLFGSVAALWAEDPLLGRALQSGIEARSMLGEGSAMDGEGKSARGLAAMTRGIEATAGLLTATDGPRVATLDLPGWDTHANQDGALARRQEALAQGLIGLKAALGPVWADTAVLLVTEFGRTVAPNGTAGTDHGTAGAALLLGGAVAGGRVLAQWPGLGSRDLLDGRDLRPTTDLRAVQAALLREHLGLGEASVARAFPGLTSEVSGVVRG